MTKTSRPLPLLTLLISAGSGVVFASQNPLPPGIADAPGDAWVPVMLMQGQRTSPVLGMAQVRDIEDGYPYKIGLFQVSGTSKFDFNLQLNARIANVQLTPLCSGSATPSVRCEPVFGVLESQKQTSSQLSLGSQYQLGPVRIGADVFRGDRSFTQFNPYLSLPAQPALTLINSTKQTGAQLSGSLDSSVGLFGLQLQVARSQLGPSGLSPSISAPLSGELNEGKVTFNWFNGNFGSTLSTRVMESPGSNLWGGLDLGLSWRTPWQGKVIFGAKNVVTSGSPPTYLDPKRAPDAVDQERVPYVRYEQDL